MYTPYPPISITSQPSKKQQKKERLIVGSNHWPIGVCLKWISNSRARCQLRQSALVWVGDCGVTENVYREWLMWVGWERWRRSNRDMNTMFTKNHKSIIFPTFHPFFIIPTQPQSLPYSPHQPQSRFNTKLYRRIFLLYFIIIPIRRHSFPNDYRLYQSQTKPKKQRTTTTTKKKLAGCRDWTSDPRICNPMLYHWAKPAEKGNHCWFQISLNNLSYYIDTPQSPPKLTPHLPFPTPQSLKYPQDQPHPTTTIMNGWISKWLTR